MALISFAIISSVYYLYSSKEKPVDDKVVAIVSGMKIYESDVKEEVFDMLLLSQKSADLKNFKVESLPDGVIEPLVKAIYVKRHIYEDAVRYGINKDPEVNRKIDSYSKRVIRESYLDKMVEGKITKDAIKSKYIDISDESEDDDKTANLEDFDKMEDQLFLMVKKDEIEKIFSDIYSKAHVKILLKR